MPAKRAKTHETAKYFGLPDNYLRAGALDGTLSGAYFVVGRRGDRVWDWDLLEARLKELCQFNVKQPESEQAAFGKLRKVL